MSDDTLRAVAGEDWEKMQAILTRPNWEPEDWREQVFIRDRIVAKLVAAVEERDGMLSAAYVHEYDSMKKLRMGYDAWAEELRLYAAHDAARDHKDEVPS